MSRTGPAADGASRATPPTTAPYPARRLRRRAGPAPRGVPPDDRLTTVLPAVRDDTTAHLRDPIDVVKAALDGTPPPPTATAPPPPPPAGGGGPPGAPPAPEGRGPARRSTGSGCAAALYIRGGRVDRAADRHLRDGLPHRRRAQARRHPDQSGVDDPGQRRQRAGENRSARGQPRRRQHRPDPGARAQRGDGRRGPRLLLQPRLLVHRLRRGRSRTTSSAATCRAGRRSPSST